MFPIIMNPNMSLTPDVIASVSPDPTNSGVSANWAVSANSGLLQPTMGAKLLDSLISRATSVPDNFAHLARQAFLNAAESAKAGRGDPGSKTPSPYFYPSPTAQQIDYLYADLAKHYGMSKETAYNEAMANTAYQRAVADMQMAGLNPASLFSAGRASVAGSGHASGLASGGFSSARGASKDDSLPGWIYFGVPALTQAVVTGATKNVGYGVVASQVAQNFLKAFNGAK